MHPLILSLFLIVSAEQQGAPSSAVTNETFPFDNTSARQVAFATSPVAPIAFSSDGSVVYAINQPGARLAFLDPATLARVGQVHIGLGAASVVGRPGSSELWVVDSIDSCVNVVDPALQTVVRTIRVGAEPRGIAFTPTGDRAYVTCAGVDQVDVIDAQTYRVARSIPIPARNPHGVVWLAGKAYVVSFLSGNGTAPAGVSGDPDAVETVEVPAPPRASALPDRDLFAIRTRATPDQDDLDPAATVSGLGTTLFNVHVRPGTNELWIPNTDALNAEHRGEVNFVAGQVVRNRITIVDATGVVPPRFVELDALAPQDRKCAQPAHVEFDPARPFAYVCGYGSDAIAVLEVAANGTVSWRGAIDLPSSRAYPRGTGPRACVVRGDALIVYDKNDAAVSRFDLASLPSGSGWSVVAAPATPLGVDLSSGFERLGRHLFTNARFSASQTSSCASCHIDGHTDGLVWDLSHYLDPEGTPDDHLKFGTDVKGPIVTQSVRRMDDGGPFHWRGEIETTNGFQKAFVDLLENSPNGSPQSIGPDFQYLRRFMDSLAWPPNPRQSLDRWFNDSQLRGADLFLSKPLEDGLTCASCHMLPAGASGEVVAESPGGIVRSSDVPSLRGVADKLTPPVQIGGRFGTRTELGAGLTHAGAIPTLRESFFRAVPTGAGKHSFGLNAQEAEHLRAFLAVFDTGIAPAAGLMVTADATNWAQVAAGDLRILREAAGRGHCDLVYVRVPRLVSGQFTELAGTYEPNTCDYRVASAASPRISQDVLLAEAASGLPVTFIGVPVGMGEPQGLDRDMDGLWDLDEIAAQTDVEDGDTDGDGFPDGHEVARGSDPRTPNSSSPDTQAPALAAPVRLVYATTNSLKLEIVTDEFCKIALSYNGGSPVARFPFNPIGDYRHWVVVGDLAPDREYRITLEMRDAAENVALDSSTVFRTRPRSLPKPARIRSIGVDVGTTVPGTPVLIGAVKVDRIGSAAGSGYAVHASVYYQDSHGALSLVADDATSLTNGSGIANFRIDLPNAGSSPGSLYFVVHSVVPPPGGAPWVRALDAQTVAVLDY